MLGPPQGAPTAGLQQSVLLMGSAALPMVLFLSQNPPASVPGPLHPVFPHGSGSLLLQLWARAETHRWHWLTCDSTFLWDLAFLTGMGPRKAAGSVPSIPSPGFSKDLPSNLCTLSFLANGHGLGRERPMILPSGPEAQAG